MDFIDDDPLQAFEQFQTVRIGQQQTEAFRRRQQDMRRARALALLAVGRRIAAARFDPDRQPHLLNRRHQIALHIMRERF